LAENLKPAFAFYYIDAQPTDPQRALRRIPHVQNAEQRKTASSEWRETANGEWGITNGEESVGAERCRARLACTTGPANGATLALGP